jgi:hypothetical protein
MTGKMADAVSTSIQAALDEIVTTDRSGHMRKDLKKMARWRQQLFTVLATLIFKRSVSVPITM